MKGLRYFVLSNQHQHHITVIQITSLENCEILRLGETKIERTIISNTRNCKLCDLISWEIVTPTCSKRKSVGMITCLTLLCSSRCTASGNYRPYYFLAPSPIITSFVIIHIFYQLCSLFAFFFSLVGCAMSVGDSSRTTGPIVELCATRNATSGREND